MSWPLLHIGDAVSVIAPAGPFEREVFERGLSAIRALGFEPKFDDSVFSRVRYLAGSDDRRFNELVAAFADSSTRAVFCARGGYGSTRFLDRVDVASLPDKPLVGFSDITALHAIWNRAGRRSIHGPVVTQLGNSPSEVKAALLGLLTRGQVTPLSGARKIIGGKARGELVGGNLSMLTRLIGTPFMPELRGKILLLEDVGERPYRLDRMLTHLKLARLFEGVAGIAIGELTGCEEKDADYSAEDVVREALTPLAIPSAIGFPVGHGAVNFPLVLGAPMTLDADAGTLS